MKIRLLQYLLLSILLAASLSCQKEMDVSPGATLRVDSRLEGKLLQIGQKYEGEKRNNFLRLIGSLDWTRSRQYEGEQGELLYRIPSKLETAYSRTGKASRRTLILHMNGESVREAYVLDVIADNSVIENERQMAHASGKAQHNSGIIKGFNGEKIYYDLGLSLQERQLYKAGQLVQLDKITAINMPNPNQVLSSGGSTAVNGEHCVTWWRITTIFYTDGSTEVIEEYLGMTCTRIGSDDLCSIEPASFQRSESIFNVGLQCGGDGGGRETETRDIIEELKDPCFKQVLAELRKEGLTNKITDALEKIFNSSDKVNLIFAEDPNLGNGIYGDAVPLNDARSIGGSLNIQVTLNSSYLAGASKEIIAETMIHEVLHAYIHATESASRNLDHHIEMGEKYINWSYQAMKELYPSMPSNDVYALVLSGFGQLQETNPNYMNDLISKHSLTPSEIVRIAEAYRKNDTGTSCNK